MSSSAMRSTKSGTTTLRSVMDDNAKKETHHTRPPQARQDAPLPGYSPGLEGVIAGESALCEVDEGAAGLRYRGYAIGDLAEQATFEEVAYLLLFGKLPTRKELGDFTAQLQTQWPLPGPVEAFIGVVPPSAHPMDILRTGVSLLGMTDQDATGEGGVSAPPGREGANVTSREANLRKSVRLLAQIPILIANAHRLAHAKHQVQPKQEMSFAENLLYLLTDRHDDEQAKAIARVLNVSLILYAEHEFNASTFAARVAASTLTDLHAAVTAAIAALKGPLHGGANEAVAAMLLEIKSRDRAERWVRDALAQKRRGGGVGPPGGRERGGPLAVIPAPVEGLVPGVRGTTWGLTTH